MGLLKGILHHYFFPHESNNYRAKSLHPSSLIFYIIALLLFQVGVSQLGHYQRNILGFATNISTQKIIELVNQKRIENNLPPLTENSELASAATNKASDMFSYNYWAHVSPTGTTPWAFITSAGYEYVYAGENLAKDFYEPADVVQAWMNSPTHRANILKPEYKDIGIAVVNGKLDGQETTLIVEEFGSTNAKVKVANVIPTISSEDRENPRVLQQPVQSGETIQNLNLQHTSVLGSIFQGMNTKTVSLVLAEFLLLVLFVDSTYMWKHRTDRLVSHSLAHFIFLAAMIGAMSVAGIGVIL